ncbi:O-methyltransferase involved in polyketide biosynthesis [Dysgonomonas sp. PH5-45]|uniref:class I SAM-dependent methyltransferase n=1 Tax=unclassified Dysgonomonas TaxID=2630389 RepID=UPI002475056D|nr:MULTISPECIES: class I SAM-dependent methyltransferase [unclassified Dysgonomonas]MDH6355229.1 O-methyltransferase involved in polyketide biosynthesis [Dysgonomonas sp. PH5-45]MDH6388148.1 O-methyltransferase involved in polyketide biosynthesis [Dysgonomonas sp. PH5-37]
MGKIKTDKLNGIPETLLIPLYYRSVLAGEDNPLIDATYDRDIVKAIDYDFSKFEADQRSLIGIASRTHIIDNITRQWLKEHPNGIIINIGAGLDTRPLRFPAARWYNVDLPESVNIREKLVPANNEVNIAADAFQRDWITQIPKHNDVLIICEALLMFFPPEKVKSFFQSIASVFHDSLLVFETIPQMMARKKKMNGNPLLWANENLTEVENWDSRLHTIATYYLPDCFSDRWQEAYATLSPLLNDELKKGFKVAVMAVNQRL